MTNATGRDSGTNLDDDLLNSQSSAMEAIFSPKFEQVVRQTA